MATSNPEAVDAVVASDHEVLFQAKALGQATLVVWSKSGDRRTYEVTVLPNLEPLRELLKESFPGEAIDLRATRESLALVGRASTRAVAERALALVAASVKGAVSNLEIAPPPPERQILLRVRFAELNRSVNTEFAFNLLSTGALNTIGRITHRADRLGGPGRDGPGRRQEIRALRPAEHFRVPSGPEPGCPDPGPGIPRHAADSGRAQPGGHQRQGGQFPGGR